MQFRLILLPVVFGTATQVQAQVVAEMTPERVQEAISWGTSAPEATLYPLVGIRPNVDVVAAVKHGKPLMRRIGGYSTPFLRVAMAARRAKTLFQPFGPSDVTPEMIEPVLEVYAFAQPIDGTPNVASVQTVVIGSPEATDHAAVTQPSTIAEVSAEFRNMFGAAASGNSVVARFPLDVLRPDMRIHVVYDVPLCHAVPRDPAGKPRKGSVASEDCSSLLVQLDKKGRWLAGVKLPREGLDEVAVR